MRIAAELIKKWPSSLVARTRVEEFSGGILNRRTLANVDCNGGGPPRYRVGRKIFYKAAELAAWIEERTETLKEV